MKPLLTCLLGHLQSRGKTGHTAEYGKCTLEIFVSNDMVHPEIGIVYRVIGER